MENEAANAYAVFTMAPYEHEYHLKVIFESHEDAISYSDYRYESYGEMTKILPTKYFPDGTGEFE